MDPIDYKLHPAYSSSLQYAAKRAYDARMETTNDAGYYPPCFKVWFDGKAMFVRTAEAAPPPNAELVCIAQAWDKTGTVQLRFNGAWTEFIEF